MDDRWCSGPNNRRHEGALCLPSNIYNQQFWALRLRHGEQATSVAVRLNLEEDPEMQSEEEEPEMQSGEPETKESTNGRPLVWGINMVRLDLSRIESSRVFNKISWRMAGLRGGRRIETVL
jgi:hypothetical protein